MFNQTALSRLISVTAAVALTVTPLLMVGVSKIAAFGAEVGYYPYGNVPEGQLSCSMGGPCIADAWSFFKWECVSYVASRMNRDHGITDVNSTQWFTNGMKGPNGKSGWFGSADTWDTNATNIGFTVDNTPTVGSIAQWKVDVNGDGDYSDAGDWYHVAYVESVNSDGSVNISEFNWNYGNGKYNARTARAQRYIHINGLGSTTLTQPANGAVISTPVVNLQWTAVNRATSYEIKLSGVPYTYSSNTTSFDLSTKAVHVYESTSWQVRAKSSDGSVGDWSAARTFSTTSNPVGNYFADVNGDGRTDAIAVRSAGVFVRKGMPDGSWDAEHQWTSTFYGNRGSYFADVTGDGKADAIIVRDRDSVGNLITGTAGQTGSSVIVRRSLGNDTFGSNELWTNNLFFGNKGNYFADVTGDGKADAIIVRDNGVWGKSIVVRRSTGSYFGSIPSVEDGNEYWASGQFVGDYGNYFADVNGDGVADAIIVRERYSSGSVIPQGDNQTVLVRISNTWHFGLSDVDDGNVSWATGKFLGNRGNYFADVDADGKTDAIIIRDNDVIVRRSTGGQFGLNQAVSDGNEVWATGIATGPRGTFFVDMASMNMTNNGVIPVDHRADLVTVSDDGVRVGIANKSNQFDEFNQYHEVQYFDPLQNWGIFLGQY